MQKKLSILFINGTYFDMEFSSNIEYDNLTGCELLFGKSGSEVILLFSCSTQLNMRFQLLIKN